MKAFKVDWGYCYGKQDIEEMDWYFPCGIIVKSLAIFCIPIFFGRNTIWIAPFVAEIVTLMFAIGLSKASKLVYQ